MWTFFNFNKYRANCFKFSQKVGGGGIQLYHRGAYSIPGCNSCSTNKYRGDKSRNRSYLEIVIKAKQCELMLQMYSKVHIFHRVHHDVDELHARHLQIHT